MNKELQKAIFKWLVDNENRWQRLNSCNQKFSNYIYTSDGGYILGGEEVAHFIKSVNQLLYA